MYVHCKKCLTSRTGDVLGAPCRTHGCDGVIERQPEFRELVDRLPEPVTCGRRDGSMVAHKFPGPDYWDKFKSNGDRVCSYCGSLHPDDFWALVQQAAEAAEDDRSAVEISSTDKPYKVYVERRNVRNAHEGGIKFYTPHLVGEPTDEQQALYREALRRSRARHKLRMADLGLGI